MSLMSKELVIMDCGVSYRDEAIKFMASTMAENGLLNDKEQYIKDVLKRENSASTAIGFSIATPHAKSSGVNETCIGFMKFNNPIQWDANSEKIKMAFQIAVPIDGGEQHLEILAAIFRNLIKEDFRKKLDEATTAEDICKVVESI